MNIFVQDFLEETKEIPPNEKTQAGIKALANSVNGDRALPYKV